MVLTYKDNEKITYPIFPLPSSNWLKADGLVTIDGLILDDKNMDSSSLGHRRLMTPYKSLFPLKQAAHNLISLVKSGKKVFIDSKGLLFIYEKTKIVKLRYKKIHKIVKKEKASLLFIRQSKIPFIIPRPPTDEMSHVGILYLDNDPWLLYEYAASQLTDTRRKI
jgi:hypothetical protein